MKDMSGRSIPISRICAARSNRIRANPIMWKPYTALVIVSKGNNHALHQHQTHPGISEHRYRERDDHFYYCALENTSGIHSFSHRSESDRYRLRAHRVLPAKWNLGRLGDDLDAI